MFTGRAETQIVKRVWVDPGDLINSCAVAPSNGQSWDTCPLTVDVAWTSVRDGSFNDNVYRQRFNNDRLVIAWC
jgi:hypothetical protein